MPSVGHALSQHPLKIWIYYVPRSDQRRFEAPGEDSGRLLANLCDEDAKANLGSDFWNHFYNIGSGKEYRISNYEFECLLLGTLGLAGPESSLTPTGLQRRTSTVSSMQTAISLKTSFTSVRTSPLRITSTVLQIRLNSALKFRDIFRRTSLQLARSPL